MRVFLSSAFSSQGYLRENVVPKLEALGCQVEARWLFEPDLKDIAPEAFVAWQQDLARQDLEDVHDADMVVYFNTWRSTTGGRKVELGYALALGKRIVMVGTPDNPFEHLVESVPTEEALYDWLAKC